MDLSSYTVSKEEQAVNKPSSVLLTQWRLSF